MLTLGQIREFVDKNLVLHLEDRKKKLLVNLIQIKCHEDKINSLEPHSTESLFVLQMFKQIDFNQSMSSICDSVMDYKQIKETIVNKPEFTLSQREYKAIPVLDYNHNYLNKLLSKYQVFTDVKRQTTKLTNGVLLKAKSKSIELLTSVSSTTINTTTHVKRESLENAFDDMPKFKESNFFKWAQVVISSMSEEELKSFLSTIFNSFPNPDLLLPYLRRTGEVEWRDDKLFNLIFTITNDSGLVKFKEDMNANSQQLPVKKKKSKVSKISKAPIPYNPELYSKLASCLMSKDQLMQLNHSLYTLGISKTNHINYVLKMGLSIEPQNYNLCLALLDKMALVQLQFNKADKQIKYYESGLKKQRLFGNSKNLMKESQDRKKLEKLHARLNFELNHLKKQLLNEYNLELINE